MKLYRCFPHSPSAKKSDPGHALFISESRSTGRINNPDIYQSSYWSAQPECAVAEVYGSSAVWSPATFFGLPQMRDSYQAIATIEIPDVLQLFTMDDARNLLKLKLRASRVVTRNNETTQAWARKIYNEGSYAGITWWSIWWPEWQSLGLWNIQQARVVKVERLDVDHEAVIAAADVLNKRVTRS